MTIIIAGHYFRQTLDEYEPQGLFVASDSAITAPASHGRQLILSGFRKVYPIPVKVWKPYFLGDSFHSYRDVYFRSECLVAIAGNTLTAQHVLNCIIEHLSQLRVTCKRGTNGAAQYVIVRHCQENPLLDCPAASRWSDDMFLPQHYDNLMSGEIIEQVVEYSINEALRTARKYKFDEAALNSLRTEFALGLHCERSRTHRLLTFTVEFVSAPDGILRCSVSKTTVEPGVVAVLGLHDIAEEAQSQFERALATYSDTANHMFSFLNEIINKERDSQTHRVDHPSYLRKFENGVLTTLATQINDSEAWI